jgi:hypothetical protein
VCRLRLSCGLHASDQFAGEGFDGGIRRGWLVDPDCLSAEESWPATAIHTFIRMMSVCTENLAVMVMSSWKACAPGSWTCEICCVTGSADAPLPRAGSRAAVTRHSF